MATTAGNTYSAYPFAGIVGMADLKLALLLNAVSPAIGGVLVRGEKGTAKSTMVRGLAALLPPVPVVPGCPYSCDPGAPDPACPAGPHGAEAAELRPVTLAELPVGATEDRLTGSLDIERVLTAGTTAFQPGLLAAAHRGVLYVDEVNLLHDHLVDLLLDAAALGVNYVEREGVSVRHASRFLLVGTMNPEEGELRPQLLDRFGLTVQVTASTDPAERAEVVRRRLAFEADPAVFGRRFAADTAALAGQVAAARAQAPASGAARRRAAPDLRRLRRVRRRRDACRPGHRPNRNRPGRLGRPGRGDGGGCPHRGPAGPPAPAPPRPLRRSRARRASPRRSPAGSGQSGLGRPRGSRRRSRRPRPRRPRGPRTAPTPIPDGPRVPRPRPRRPRAPGPSPDGPDARPQRSPRAAGQPGKSVIPAVQSSHRNPVGPTGITGGPVPRPAADCARRRRGRPRPPLRRPRPVRPHRGRARPAGPPLRPAPPRHRPRRRRAGPARRRRPSRPSTGLPELPTP